MYVMMYVHKTMCVLAVFRQSNFLEFTRDPFVLFSLV